MSISALACPLSCVISGSVQSSIYLPNESGECEKRKTESLQTKNAATLVGSRRFRMGNPSEREAYASALLSAAFASRAAA